MMTMHLDRLIDGRRGCVAQGKEPLVRHLQMMKLQCADEEFLPAAFSPPRDGVTAGTTVRRLGRLARRPTTTTTTCAAAPAPKDS